MSDWWVLLALGLLLPLSVPAALSCAHLTMPDFSVPDRGVAVIGMRWLVIRLLRAVLGVRVPFAEFFLGDICDTSLALQSVSSAAWLWCWFNRRILIALRLVHQFSIPAALIVSNITMHQFPINPYSVTKACREKAGR